MLFLEPSVSPFGSYTISAEAFGSLGLVRHNTHVDPANKRREEAALSPGQVLTSGCGS